VEINSVAKTWISVGEGASVGGEGWG